METMNKKSNPEFFEIMCKFQEVIDNLHKDVCINNRLISKIKVVDRSPDSEKCDRAKTIDIIGELDQKINLLNQIGQDLKNNNSILNSIVGENDTTV